MNAIIRNPFDAGGYSLAEMTQAINILPNLYTRLGEIGLFSFEGITQRSVIIEQFDGALNVLPSVPLGAPATVATRQGRSMRSFGLPWIPHDDVILASDIQGVPAFGGSENEQLATVMMRKLTLMRRKHAQTREYMEMNALRGIVKDGAGTTLYNYFTEFGLAQISVDFLLGTATTIVQAKVRDAIRAVEDNLLGESMIREPFWLWPKRILSGRSSGPMVPPSSRIMARSITFSSSRTLPGQSCFISSSSASLLTVLGASPRACRLRKWSTRIGMSSRR